jgi:septum site-determining protein MinD
MITSFKGGVGKSTVAVNLAAGLSRRKHKTLIADLDASSCSVDLLTGCETDGIYNFCDVMAGRAALSDAVISLNRGKTSGLDIIRAPFTYDSYDLSDGMFREFIETAKSAYDFVIFDTPPGIFRFSGILSQKADFVLVITLHSAVSVRAAEKLSLFLSENDAKNVSLIINCFNSEGIIKGTHPGIVDIIELSKIKLIGIVEYNRQFQDLQESGKTAYDMKQKRMESFFSGIIDRMLERHVNLDKKYNGQKTSRLYFKKGKK